MVKTSFMQVPFYEQRATGPEMWGYSTGRILEGYQIVPGR